MQMKDRSDDVLHAVEELGLFRAPRRIESTGFADAAVLEGEVSIAGHEVILWLVLDSSFPLTLPCFFLRPWDALGVIPHVDERGKVCFADPEGLVLDRYRPMEVRRTLLAGLANDNKQQLKRLLKRRPHRKEYVIVKLPRPLGGATLFGIQYDGIGRHHPMHKDGVASCLVPLRLQRLDRGYLVRRSGGIAELSAKRVLLVGCGA